jgi:hypothetical protein
MPTETRKIAFERDEIRAALIHYALRTEMRLPKESIDKVKVSPEKATVTFVYARQQGMNQPREINFTEQHVAAAVILYCKTHGFPLPREAEKMLKPEGTGISMMMRLVHDDSNPGQAIAS